MAGFHFMCVLSSLAVGNKEKAVRILQRATSLGAEPASTINLAFLRLTEGKTQLLTESAHEGDTGKVTRQRFVTA